MKNGKTKKNKCNLKSGQKISFQKYMPGPKRALIIENPQNCFFSKGSMGFMSDSNKDSELIRKINYLINLEEYKDNKHILAGKSGKKSKKLLSTFMGESIFNTGSRKKYYYDIIIFSCVINVPDSVTFSSHHYLRNSSLFKPYSSPTKKIKSKSYIPKFDEKNKYGEDPIILKPDHALTDGSDSYKKGNKKIRGIEIHDDIDKDCLYRPFSNYANNVFIGKSFYNNRGFILNKGKQDTGAYSAFRNLDRKKTGLEKFLKCNKVNTITICGVGRENDILNTIKDSKLIKSIKSTFVVMDACKSLNLEIDELVITEEIKKDMDKEDFENPKNKYSKLVKETGGDLVTIDVLMDITKTDEIYKKSSKVTNLQASISDMSSLFSQNKKVKIKQSLFENKKTKEKKTKRNNNKNKGIFSSFL